MSLNTAYSRRFAPPFGALLDLAHPLARGLVGAWLFNENNGPRVSDGGQRHYTGVLTGCTWVGGSRGPALSFNGSTDVVTVANPADLSLAALPGLTILGWIRPGVAQTGNILNKDGNSGYRYRVNSDRTVAVLVGGSNQVASAGTAPGGVWTHAAVTGDTSGVKVYLNGRLSGAGGFSMAATPADAGQALLFGFGAFGEVYSGAINEHYLYRRSLSAAEILWHYEEPLALYPAENARRWFFATPPVTILEAAVPMPLECGGTVELGRAALLPVEATATVEGAPPVLVEAVGGLALFTALQVEVLGGVLGHGRSFPIEWQASLLLSADPPLPVEVKASLEAAPRMPFEAAGVILLEATANLPLEALGGAIAKALLQLEVAGEDDTVLAFVWKVLHAADAPQAFQWVVLPEIIVGAAQGFSWRVYDEAPALGLRWRVIPGEILELFDAVGVGAAAGIGDDVLLPVGRATKD
jgi:hypothetical protein